MRWDPLRGIFPPPVGPPVFIANYFPLCVDIDFVRQIAPYSRDLFLNFCRFPPMNTGDSGEKLRFPHAPTPFISIDLAVAPAIAGSRRFLG